MSGLVGIAGRKNQLDFALQRIVHHLAQAPQKTRRPAIEPRGRVQVAILVHASVQIGQMQNWNALHWPTLSYLSVT